MSTVDEDVEELERREGLLRKAVESLRRAGYGYNHDLSVPIQKEIGKLDDKIEDSVEELDYG